MTNSFRPNDGVWFSGAALNLTAAGPSTTLILTDTTPVDCTPLSNRGLEAVLITTVREPSTYALLALGIAALFMAQRSRTRRS